MSNQDLPLFDYAYKSKQSHISQEFIKVVEKFDAFGTTTRREQFDQDGHSVPLYINEFWTSKQRAAHSLHEISYRACFKPQLPAFFIDRLSRPGDYVYDPFMGRGTTILESALRNRIPIGCDINPLSKILVAPRLNPPEIESLENSLNSLEFKKTPQTKDEELLTFFESNTLGEIHELRDFIHSSENKVNTQIRDWVRMVSTNRLTGHSSGFFSVYTLPPNQATSLKAQKRINEKRDQKPEYRDTKKIILKKSRSLFKKLTEDEKKLLRSLNSNANLMTGSADDTPGIPDNSVQLVVTSPPFLDVVDYQGDNWMRCWFNGIDAQAVPIWHINKPEKWIDHMAGVFKELERVLKPGGYVAFEVGDIRGGKILMESLALPAAASAGLNPVLIMVNDQEFTKTANCWGVTNSKKGTNTNRILVLQKAPNPH